MTIQPTTSYEKLVFDFESQLEKRALEFARECEKGVIDYIFETLSRLDGDYLAFSRKLYGHDYASGQLQEIEKDIKILIEKVGKYGER